MLRTKIYFHYSRYASVLCQSECACLHKTVNMVVFFVKSKENGRALMPMYRVVPITKREYQMVFVHRMEYTTNFIIKLIYFFLCLVYWHVRECKNSLFISVFLLLIFIVDLEVSELVCVLSGGNNTEPVTKVVLLQVLLRQIFQVPKEKTTSFTNNVNTGHFLTLLDYFYQSYETKIFLWKTNGSFSVITEHFYTFFINVSSQIENQNLLSRRQALWNSILDTSYGFVDQTNVKILTERQMEQHQTYISWLLEQKANIVM